MALTQVPYSMLSADLQGATFGFKNRIINGAMGIWQRGTSGFSTANGTYTADRWKNDQTITVAQSSDVPTNTAQYSLDVTQTTPSYGTFVQNIESANCYDLVGQSVTVSFWAKNVSGALGLNVILRYATAKDNFATTTNISAVTVASNPSSSWTYYTTTFTNLPSSVANGLQLGIYRDSGTGQTRYTNIQLEKGSTATSFDYRPYGTELALCQRYYYRVTAQAAGDYTIATATTAISTTQTFTMTNFPVSMRTKPTALEQSGTASDYVVVRCGSATFTSCSAVPSFSQAGLTSAMSIFTVASGLTNGAAGLVYGNTTSAYLGWSAEL